jgi:hypothetical protein
MLVITFDESGYTTSDTTTKDGQTSLDLIFVGDAPAWSDAEIEDVIAFLKTPDDGDAARSRR